MSRFATLILLLVLFVALTSLACSVDRFVVDATPDAVNRPVLVITPPPPTLTPIPIGTTLDR